MSEIKTLQNIYKTEGLKFIYDLFNHYVIISEKICGTRFSFKILDDGNFEFYKKDGKISDIDILMNSSFESPINFIKNLSPQIKSTLLPNFTYGFKIFEKEPIFVQYDNIHPSALILTDIKNSNDKVIDDVNILKRVALNLGVEQPPIIFNGKLDEAQKQNITNYLKLTPSEIYIKLGDTSFTRFIISILNPLLTHTTGKSSIDLPIDSIIFKFIDLDKKNSFIAKLVDPSIEQIVGNYNGKKEIKDLYPIVLGDIVEFIQKKNLDLYKLKRVVNEERYLELIYFIFNDYISRSGSKYDGVDDLSIGSISKKFNINSNLIFSEKTKAIIQKSEVLKNILKIFISAFSKSKFKRTETITEVLIKNIELAKEKINNRVIKAEAEIMNEMLTFEEFLKNKK